MATSLNLDEELKAQVQALATKRQRTSHWIMQEAIARYVRQEQAREQLKEDAMASWVEFRETGLHLTHSEVSAWLATWGTDVETTAPECHE